MFKNFLSVLHALNFTTLNSSYYRKVKCPLSMLPGDELLGNEREKAAMEGLRELAEQGEILEVSGWVHPYGWLLNPEEASKAILKFLGNTKTKKAKIR